MSQANLHRLYEGKVGPAVIEAATVDNTVQTNSTQLEPGWYVIEATVAIRFLQTTEVVSGTPPSAGTLGTKGRRLPADTELHFCVADDKSDGYLIWTRVSSSGTVSVYKTDEIYEGA
jgi:hypothetical protein